MFDVESFWAAILSEDIAQIIEAYQSLPNADEREAVYQHVLRMATEEDWSEPQRVAAQAAVAVIEPLRHTEQ